MYKCVVSSHMNPNLSGVAKFNNILANKLNCKCISITDYNKEIDKKDRILLSIKLADLQEYEINEIKRFLNNVIENKISFDLFFHALSDISIEYDLIEACSRIYCANSEIRHALRGFDKVLLDSWCPHLVNVNKRIEIADFNIFSFGMAHKLQLGYYKELHKKLISYKSKHSIWISTAFHEKASFGDFDEISNQLNDIFGECIHFLGFLSDEAINYFLDRIQLFVAFFPKGVRSNNTSIYVPMEKGIPVLTNLDQHSPHWLKHGKNIIDINDLNGDLLTTEILKEIGKEGAIDYHKNASWESLVKSIAL